MKVLVVDDDYEKVVSIAAVVETAGLKKVEFAHETTGHAARKFLQSKSVDLIIIDLHLPDTIGTAGRAEGGLSFFDLVCLDDGAQLPGDILFITGREDLLDSARSEAQKRGSLVLQWRDDLEDWKHTLVGRLRFIEKKLLRQPLEGKCVDIAVVTALRAPELNAVLALPYSWRQSRLNGETATFFQGTVPRESGELSIVAMAALRKGMPSSAALATKMAITFRPRYLVMLGICAGIKGKTSLGDVLVADPTWDWGSGKHAISDDQTSIFLVAPHQRPLDAEISNVVTEISSTPGLTKNIRGAWNGSLPSSEFKVHLGPMASGASVIADQESTRRILEQNKDLLGIEMEAYAVMAATEYCGAHGPKAVVIKSVCDFADSEKGDNWQAYASYTSASFADQLFRHPKF